MARRLPRAGAIPADYDPHLTSNPGPVTIAPTRCLTRASSQAPQSVKQECAICSGVIMLDDVRPVTGPADALVVEAGPLVRLHVELSRMLWRIGPAWAVLAGAVAARAAWLAPDILLRLATAVVLADLVWGILRKVISDQSHGASPALAVPQLPYAQPAAPLARFLASLAAGQGREQLDGRAAWQGLFAGLVFTVVLSWLLGGFALAISAITVGVVLLGWALARRGSRPAFCLAMLDVALPWCLGAALALSGHESSILLPWFWLAMSFTILQWGVHRARLSDGQRMGGLWLGQIVVLAALLGLRQPWALAVTVVLFAPPSWWLARRGDAVRTLAHCLPWWWAAMLLAAAIAG